jgi:hypothetical protein
VVNPFERGTISLLALILASLLAQLSIPRTPSRLSRFLREFLLVAPAALLYFLVRGLVDARRADAIRHANQVIDFEKMLGIHRERALQAHILRSEFLVDVVNWIYIWGHWPVVILTMTWLILFRHERFATYRNAFLIAGATGMVIFALYPVAPPRLVDNLGFIDTVTERSRSYRVLQPPALTNPYAAMPSLHFGWNLLMGIAVFRESRHWAGKLFGVVMPIAMFASIVLTANHYILDGVVGGLIVLLSLAISLTLPVMSQEMQWSLPVRTVKSRIENE